MAWRESQNAGQPLRRQIENCSRSERQQRVGLAQSFLSFLWDEGGAHEVVPFHPRHMPGQIIVSFGDRRLYWVHRRGEAISYPIAIPREKSRWAGVTGI